MMCPTEITREQFQALTPSVYLKQGFRDELGRLREELTGFWATAAAVQLATVSTRELATTLMAIGQALPLYDGTAAERFTGACCEALETVARMYQTAPSQDLAGYLDQCAQTVRSEHDFADLQEHIKGVLRQHTLIARLRNSAAD
jgi:hypothetical protein